MTDDWMITSEDENLYTSDMNKEFTNEFENLTTIIGDTCVSDCIDKIMGIQIPIISTVSTIYKMGNSLTSAFNLKKWLFLLTTAIIVLLMMREINILKIMNKTRGNITSK